MSGARAIRIAIVAGEASGDQLGASLIRALRSRSLDGRLEFSGVGGPAMIEEGVASLFPQSDIAVMGLGPVIRRLPLLLRRIRETADAIIAEQPDVLVTIDSPDFCKRVAKRVRAQRPGIPIVHWVCPSVWAWRPGRAPAMKPYIDRVLCLLPFEPEALRRLKGPEGVYIGHPLVEMTELLRPQNSIEAGRRKDAERPVILILPGSRRAEISRLLPIFLDVARDLPTSGAELRLPTLPHIEAMVREIVAASGVPVTVTTGDANKQSAMRNARAALAASGTVTLELALAGIPMVTAYRVADWEAFIARRLVTVSTAILPNLVLGEHVVPEFIQQDASLANLTSALGAILPEGPARARQIDAFARVDAIMRGEGKRPSEEAARAVLEMLGKERRH